jgi:PAS domain S-box-containing protein
MALVDEVGNLIKTNISLSKILGYSGLALEGMNLSSITLPEDREVDLALKHELVQKTLTSYKINKRLIHQSKRIIICQIHVSKIESDIHSENFWLYQFNDITAIIEAEKASRKAQEQLELVIKGAYDGWWDWDISEAGSQPSYSSSWYNMIGYPELSGEISEEFWISIVHPEDYKELKKYFVDLLEGNSTHYSVAIRLKHRLGHYITVSSKAFISRDSRGVAHRITGADSDITKIIERERRYKAIFNSTFQFTGLLAPDGTVLEANDSLLSFTNTSPSEVIGKKLWDSPCWPQKEAYIEILKESIQKVNQGHFDRFNLWIRDMNGDPMVIDFSMKPVLDQYGDVILLIPEGRNITSQIITKQALNDSEARWKYALEGSGDGVWDWDLETNEIYFSDNWKRMLGFQPDELENSLSVWEALVHPEDLSDVLQRLYSYIHGTTKVYLKEYRIRCKSGEYTWVLDRGAIVEWTKEGKPKRMIGTHTDINNQKTIEKQLRTTLDLVSDQNNRLLNFAHIVSHNLRSHAGNIHTVLNFLDGEQNPEERTQLYAFLRQASDQLAETIDNLNEVVAIQTNINDKKYEKDLLRECQKVIHNIQGLIKETGAKIEFEIFPDTKVWVIPSYLESILLNILTNAIKYKHPDRKPVIKIKAFTVNNGTCIEISDNGLGIDLKLNREKIFGMYKTFHGNKDARGIGLFITKNQISAMGGTIDLYSQINQGTTFSIFLPAAHLEAEV